MTLKRPTCLHVPELTGDTEATLSWESVFDAVGYELDGIYDDAFESSLSGWQWLDINCSENTWRTATDNLTWRQIEQLSAQGRSWDSIEFEGALWSALESNDYSWREIHGLPISFTIFRGAGTTIPAPDQGVAWNDFECLETDWSSITDIYTWRQIEYWQSLGLEWAQLESEGFSWNQIMHSDHLDHAWGALHRAAARGISWDSMS